MALKQNSVFYILRIKGKPGKADRIQIRDAGFDLVEQSSNLPEGFAEEKIMQIPYGKIEKIEL